VPSYNIYIQHIYCNVKRGFSKTSILGKSTLDLTEKLALWTIFPKPFTENIKNGIIGNMYKGDG
jgi:hypothetical protein